MALTKIGNPMLGPQVKTQYKVRNLDANINSNDADIASMKITDTPVGWTCVVVLVTDLEAGGGSATIEAHHNGNAVVRNRLVENTSASGSVRVNFSSESTPFVLQNSTIIVKAVGFSTSDDSLYTGSKIIALYYPPGMLVEKT